MCGAGNLEAWRRPVFVAGGRTITAGDVILAADCRGDLWPAWRRLRSLLEREAEAAERGDPVDEARLQAMSEQFRYERDLITTEETERWLEARGLTLDDFNAHFQRRFWAEAAGEADDESPAPGDAASPPDTIWPLLVSELWFSGDLDRMAMRLSWSMAAAGAGGVAAGEQAGEDAPPAPESPDEPAIEWPAALDDPAWREAVEAGEAAYRRERARLEASDQAARLLPALRLPLSRVDLEIVDADSLDAVREMAMCVREDGLALEDVAAQAGYPYERIAVLLEDLAEDLQRRVASAAPADLLDPLEHDDGVRLIRLRAKTAPELGDDEVRDRINRRIRDRHFSELSSGYVQWVLGPAVAP